MGGYGYHTIMEITCSKCKSAMYRYKADKIECYKCKKCDYKFTLYSLNTKEVDNISYCPSLDGKI